MARRLDWSFLVHHTDRPAEEVVLAHPHPLAGSRARLSLSARRRRLPMGSGSAAMMTLGADRLSPALDPARACRAASDLVAVAADPANARSYVVFPPTRLLKDLKPTEETPAHSPWWLTALRMLLAALIILALARPGAQSRAPELRRHRAAPAARRSTMAGPRPRIGPSGARRSRRQSTAPRATAGPSCSRPPRRASRSAIR